jgi:DNA-binding transcriptional regulator YbjK
MPTNHKRPARAHRQAGTATRSRGARTRREILDAALRVIAREGVRGATHRAIAVEAGVQLSLTTYYFTDLGELVASAFEAFMDRGNAELESLWAAAFVYLDRTGPLADADVATRRRVRDYALRGIVGYVSEKIAYQPVGLAVEHQFFFEALNDARLTELAARHRARLVAPMIELCRRFGSPQPETDADLLFGTIIRLEYESLLAPASARLRRASLRRSLGRLLDLLLRLG